MTETEFQAELESILAGFSGRFGLAAKRLDDGLSVGFNDAQVFPAASVVKLPMLIAALQRVERHELSLEQRFELTADDRAGGSGVLLVCDSGLQLTLKDLLTLMIVVSDNTATNMVMDVLGGPEAINQQFAGMGLEVTRVFGKLQVAWERKTEAQRQGRLSELTPAEMLALLEQLWNGGLLGPGLRALALEILGKQQYTEMIGRHLPDGTSIATKSGQITGVRNDAGFVLTARPYMIAMASRDGQDARYHIDNEGVLVAARVSKLVFDYFSSQN